MESNSETDIDHTISEIIEIIKKMQDTIQDVKHTIEEIQREITDKIQSETDLSVKPEFVL